MDRIDLASLGIFRLFQATYSKTKVDKHEYVHKVGGIRGSGGVYYTIPPPSKK